MLPATRSGGESAARGRAVYEARCASCHEPEAQHAGPTGELFVQKSFLQSELGTDPAASITVSTPVASPSGSISAGTCRHAGAFVAHLGYARWGVSDEELSIWGRESIRGPSFFREPLLGWNGPQNGLQDFPSVEAGTSYVANSLAGVWATAPFLHNNSVPTIRDLLEPAAGRPAAFTVGDRELEPARLGYRSQTVATCGKDDPAAWTPGSPAIATIRVRHGPSSTGQRRAARVSQNALSGCPLSGKSFWPCLRRHLKVRTGRSTPLCPSPAPGSCAAVLDDLGLEKRHRLLLVIGHPGAVEAR